MAGSLFLVQYAPASAEARAASLRRKGWEVEVEHENGGRAYRAIRTRVPDVVVLDLTRRASHGREVGAALRGLRATRELPIVCIEEAIEAREETRAKIPDAIFTTASTLDEALEDARPRKSAPQSSKRRKADLPDGDGRTSGVFEEEEVRPSSRRRSSA